MKNLLLCTAVFACFSGSPYFLQSGPERSGPDNPVVQFAGWEQAAEDALPFPTRPLGQAHAHNDYEHERPLFSALENGFNFVEVDVYLIDDELFVSHLQPLFPDTTSTLRALYLQPLKMLVERNGGRVFSQSTQPLYLMIDIKTDAAQTYQKLKSYLEPYRSFLTHFTGNKVDQRAVTVFLSGNRPVEMMAAEKHRIMCLDGRIEDLGKGYAPELMPVVSERFSDIFGIQIPGWPISSHQWEVLRRLAELTHREGKKLRLWASPEREDVWEKLLTHGADLINTDELEKLRRFLQRRQLGMYFSYQ